MQTKGPWALYQKDLEKNEFKENVLQEKVVSQLQAIYDELMVVYHQSRRRHFLVKFLDAKKNTSVRGLYLWGGVGRGKTYLVDTFFDALPFQRKMRTHFHRFMQRIHYELSQKSGEINPLKSIARQVASEAKVICFDEFFVSDIGDAMILSELIKSLLDSGVTLVATSNIEPDRLYENGLQRSRFLPVIDLIKTHTKVIHLDSVIDYRLRTLEQADLYYHPLDDRAQKCIEERFHHLIPDEKHVVRQARIRILGRQLLADAICDDVVWFNFSELCVGPRSQNDYIELSKLFHAVIISDVPQMTSTQDDIVRRFINLIDEFYDRRVKVIISAEVPIIDLYASGLLNFEFQRTISRLLEMQSHHYLSCEHLG